MPSVSNLLMYNYDALKQLQGSQKNKVKIKNPSGISPEVLLTL
jgi:hypothetical protein